jgi:CelD/BcsL family acetyltransferase involved in cellulose biosynthesis
MPRLLDRGALDLWWLEVGERPVAAVYNFVWDNKVHFYQSGRATDLPKKVRIGIVAHALVMQRAIAEGRREYDFLAGTTQYKMQMALSTRPLWRLRVVRSESRERLRLGMERPRRIARALAGRFRARWSGLLPLTKAVGRRGGGR